MPYPPVIQFETRAHEAEAQARLARERFGARVPNATHGLPRFMSWLPFPRLRTRSESACLTKLTPTDCQAQLPLF
jgi:hypothetical protein